MAPNWNSEFDNLNDFSLERLSYYAGEKLAYCKIPGTYSCARCSNQLFKSEDKFTPLSAKLAEFPAFRATVDGNSVKTRQIENFGLSRTEVLCNQCGLHVGFLFQDGAESGDNHPNAKNRYCVLSLSLRLTPSDNSDAPDFSSEYDTIFSELKDQEQQAKQILDNGNDIEPIIEPDEFTEPENKAPIESKPAEVKPEATQRSTPATRSVPEKSKAPEPKPSQDITAPKSRQPAKQNQKLQKTDSKKKSNKPPSEPFIKLNVVVPPTILFSLGFAFIYLGYRSHSQF